MKLSRYQRYPQVVIETAVYLFKTENISYRSVSEKMLAMGVKVSHKTIYEWVQEYSAGIKSKIRNRMETMSEHFIEGAPVRCNGEDLIMYQIMNRDKSRIDIYLRPNKNITAAKKYFIKMSYK